MKIKKTFFLIVGLFAISIITLNAASLQQIVDEANQAYTLEDYSRAIELYQQVIDSGMVAPELFYNLGNAHFRENRIAAAILNYERAIRLRPNDENFRHNLQVANRQTIDLIEPVPVIFYERWINSFLRLQSVDNWAWSGITSLFIFLGLLSLYFFSRSGRIRKLAFSIALIFLLFSGLSFTAAHMQYKRFHQQQEAIIFSPRITARSAPGETSPVLFVLHEGSKVSITNEVGEWAEVRLANGNVGWIRTNSFKVI